MLFAQSFSACDKHIHFGSGLQDYDSSVRMSMMVHNVCLNSVIGTVTHACTCVVQKSSHTLVCWIITTFMVAFNIIC